MAANSEIRELALALLDAEDAAGLDPGLRARELRKRLYDLHNGELMTELVVTAVTCMALETGMTPRSVYEGLFAVCPTDRDWRSMEEAWREDHD